MCGPPACLFTQPAVVMVVTNIRYAHLYIRRRLTLRLKKPLQPLQARIPGNQAGVCHFPGFLNTLKILEVSLTIMLSAASVSTHYTGQAALSGETNDGEADLDCDDGELEKEEENDEEENDEKEDDEENDEEDDRDE